MRDLTPFIEQLRDAAELLEALPGRNDDEDRELNGIAALVREAEALIIRLAP